MTSLIPAFNFHEVFVVPWKEDFANTIWIVLMGFLATAACGLAGTYLIWRRMALVGDAISHSILPGIAVAFLLSNSRSTLPMFLGALAAGILTTIIIEVIHKKTRVKQDSAIGIAFTSLFAVGVIIISLYASKVDLDQECVLYGEIAFVVPLFQPDVSIAGISLGPQPVVRMAAVAIVVITLIFLFYKELLVSSFDPGLAFSVGINATAIHYGLMCVLSIVVVSAFESVGAILVIAMLILPGATASLLWRRLPGILSLAVLHAAFSSVLGLHLATWLECSIAPAMVVMGALLFGLAWIFSPDQGLIKYLIPTRTEQSGSPSAFKQSGREV
jgi:manganese/zinc/iron transport system permease protein